MRVFILTVLVVFLLCGSVNATEWSSIAAGMNAGDWVQLTVRDSNGTVTTASDISKLSGNLGGVTNSNILEFSTESCYSSIHKKLVFAGGPHTGESGLVVYDENTDRWKTWPQLTNPWAEIGQATAFGHTYSLNTCSRLDGRHYLGMGFVSTAWRMVRRYDPVSDSWDATIPDLPGSGDFGRIIANVGHAMEFYPDFGSQGTLFYLSGNTTVSSNCDMGDGFGSRPCYYAAYLDVASNQWVNVLGPIPVINSQNKDTRALISVYSSSCQCILWGGGSKNDRVWMKIFVNGSGQLQMVRVADAPVPMTTRFTLAAEDPNSDEIVVFSGPEQGLPGSGTFSKWIYRISSDSWVLDTGFSISGTIFDSPNPTLSKTNEVVLTPIYPLGVIHLWEYTGAGGSMWLYKPSASSSSPPEPDNDPPTIPTNVQSPAQTSTTTQLTWNASSDNSGISNYKIYRGGTHTGTSVTTSFTDFGLFPNTTYTYRVSAVDLAGNESGLSSTVTVATEDSQSQSDPEQDFADRCAAAGNILCYGFDTQADVDQYQLINTSVDRSSCEHQELSYNPCGWVDPNIKASGSGSLRFEFPSNSTSGLPGQFPINFSGSPHRGSPTNGPGPFNVLFGEGDTFYISWRQRMDDAFLHPFAASGGGGFKQIIISAGDRDNFTAGSCTILEIVQQNVDTRGFPAWYDACSGPNPFAPFQKNVGNSIHVKQNFGDYFSAPTCDSRHHVTSTTPNKFPPDDPPCFSYFRHVNQWVTYQIKVQIGTWGQNDSEVTIWAAGPNDLDWMLLHRESDLQLDNNSPSVLQYGKLWLLPFLTGKDPSESHAPAHTWYDELIVSTSFISAPNSPLDTTAPSAPESLRIVP